MAIGCLIGGVMIQRYGRRMTLLILNFPFVLGWVVLSMSTNIEMIMVGRLVTGLCTGLLGPAAPIFIGETSAPALRGFLLAGITFAVSLGVFLVHTLGWFCTWQTTAVISGICPFISYILVGQVPESPSWLLSQNRTDEAAAAFKWFRGHDPEAVAEFKSMVEGQKFQEAKGNLTNYSIYSWTRMKESFSTHTFLQPLFILLVFFGTMQGTGINVIIFYSVTIVEQVFGDGINKYVATFITDLLRLAVSIMACVIIRRVGRRSLLTYSGIATALSLFALSLYLFLVNEYVELKTMPWIPLVILLAYVAAVTIGMNPLPWCVVGELFATEHRALGSALVTQFNFISMFASVKSSPFLFEHYGIGNAFLIYGIITVCGMVYLLMYLPETRNRSLLEIENEFRTRRTGTTNKVSAAWWSVNHTHTHPTTIGSSRKYCLMYIVIMVLMWMKTSTKRFSH